MAKPIDKKVIDYIKTWAGKKTTYEIAIDLEVSFSTIRKYAADLNISLVLPERVERANMISQAVKDHHATKTVSEISAMLKVPYGTVRYHGSELGLCFKSGEENRVKKVVEQGEYFNESQRTNWLI